MVCPDLTICEIISFEDMLKTLCTIPPMPSNLDEWKNRMTTATESITKDVLQKVWYEFDYRLMSFV